MNNLDGAILGQGKFQSPKMAASDVRVGRVCFLLIYVLASNGRTVNFFYKSNFLGPANLSAWHD
jgi:hypothetical protein